MSTVFTRVYGLIEGVRLVNGLGVRFRSSIIMRCTVCTVFSGNSPGNCVLVLAGRSPKRATPKKRTFARSVSFLKKKPYRPFTRDGKRLKTVRQTVHQPFTFAETVHPLGEIRRKGKR